MRPMTGSATKQSSFCCGGGLLRFARNDESETSEAKFFFVIPGREQSERARNLELPGSSLRNAPE
jgi:hypothetical protein